MTLQIRFACIKMLFPAFMLLIFTGCATDGTNPDLKQLQVSDQVAISEQDNTLSNDAPVEDSSEGPSVNTQKSPFRKTLIPPSNSARPQLITGNGEIWKMPLTPLTRPILLY